MSDHDSTTDRYTFEWHHSVKDFSRAEWDALAEPVRTPFLEWEWLRCLEDSGSITPENGWLPCHLGVRNAGKLVAAAPLYIKGHSDGEFVFDYAFAEVAEQIDVAYYPKMVGMSPATPSAGYRFLIDTTIDSETITAAMLEVIAEFCRVNEVSGCAFNFAETEWVADVTANGWLPWKHQSYEWLNEGFSSFDDYLSGFTKNQRRNIRRERAAVRDAGLRIEYLTGDGIPESLMPVMYRYYKNTNDQFGMWAARFLNREFFAMLHPGYRNRLLMIAAFAESDPTPVAISFLVVKNDFMVGRYWGCHEFFDALHFEACYYAPIEWAIENGIRVFDPGMGSSHKIRRGFRAVENYSLHRFIDPTMQHILETNLPRINRHEDAHIEYLNAASPLKAPGS